MDRSFPEQAPLHGAILLPVRAVLSLGVGAELLITLGPDLALDGAGLDQVDLDTAAGKLQAQGVYQTFQGGFTGYVGAPIGLAANPKTELFWTMRP